MAKNVLIVDDSPTIRRFVQRALSLTPLELGTVREAGNGSEALDVLRQQPIDLVFADLTMPVMDGVTMIETLRREPNPALKNLPVIVISAEGSDERRAHLRELGVTTFVRKPFTPEQFTAAVQGLLATGA